MKKQIFFLSIGLFLTACSNKIVMNSFENNEKKKHIIEMPKKYKMSKEVEPHGYASYRISKNDTLKFFVSNNYKDGFLTINDKVDKYGQGVFLIMMTSDSLTLNGKDLNGYWMEKKVKGIIYGYVNCNEKEKLFYENILIKNNLNGHQ